VDSQVRQLAVFTLGELEYAIDILSIQQIVRPQTVRRLPRAPAFVKGVIDLRGQVIPVLDLGQRFGLEPGDGAGATRLIIVRCATRLLGLLVDRVLGVHRAGPEDLHPTPHWITGPEAAVFSGLCRREGHLVLILELSALLSLDDKVRLNAFEAHPEGRDTDGDEGIVREAPDGDRTGVPKPGDEGPVAGGRAEA
jgi:purine-binding chemotaxis protein CheW